MNDDVKFFFDHAGYSYGPGEAPGTARVQNAEALAACEAWARKHMLYLWQVDPEIDSSDFRDDVPAYPQWVLYGYLNAEFVEALCGIDFGPEGAPDENEPQKRVYEAEMAREILAQADEERDLPGWHEMTR